MRTDLQAPGSEARSLPLPPLAGMEGAAGAAPAAAPGALINLGGVPLFQKVDVGVWAFVFLFFSVCCLLRGGEVAPSLLGAAAIVAIMFLVGAAVELIIESLRDIRGLGTLVGFITNGPEALCLVVGLLAGDILFGASTPLGSNFVNPVMLVIAAALTGAFPRVARTHPRYTWICCGLTAALAIGFFWFPENRRWLWLAIALPLTVILFLKRPPEAAEEEAGDAPPSRTWLLPALAVLVAAGYLLDPAVGYTAAHSHAPKGVIGFFVLATLTSWPEFKSCLALNRRGRYLSSVLNITVSNVTNIWLAWTGVAVWHWLG